MGWAQATGRAPAATSACGSSTNRDDRSSLTSTSACWASPSKPCLPCRDASASPVDHAVRCHPGRSSGGWVNVLITDVDTGSGWPRSRPARTALVAPRAVRRQPPRSPRRRRQPHLRRSAAGGHRLQPRGVRAVDRSERTRARRSRSRPRRLRPAAAELGLRPPTLGRPRSPRARRTFAPRGRSGDHRDSWHEGAVVRCRRPRRRWSARPASARSQDRVRTGTTPRSARLPRRGIRSAPRPAASTPSSTPRAESDTD